MIGFFGFGLAELLIIALFIAGVVFFFSRGKVFRGGFRKLFLQFSLRELLLAMTAGGALIALSYHEYPGRRSGFCNTFDPKQTLAQACKDQGVAASDWGSETGGRGYYNEFETDCALHVTLPADQAAPVFVRFRDRVRAEIEAAGCRITGEGGGSRLTFSLSYVSGRQSGRVIAYGLVDGDELNLFVVHFEYRQR
jgi:hypothetical protein